MKIESLREIRRPEGCKCSLYYLNGIFVHEDDCPKSAASIDKRLMKELDRDDEAKERRPIPPGKTLLMYGPPRKTKGFP